MELDCVQEQFSETGSCPCLFYGKPLFFRIIPFFTLFISQRRFCRRVDQWECKEVLGPSNDQPEASIVDSIVASCISQFIVAVKLTSDPILQQTHYDDDNSDFPNVPNQTYHQYFWQFNAKHLLDICNGLSDHWALGATSIVKIGEVRLSDGIGGGVRDI